MTCPAGVLGCTCSKPASIPICCTGVPVTLPDGRLQYKCGHVYRIVFQLVEQPEPGAKKTVVSVSVSARRTA